MSDAPKRTDAAPPSDLDEVNKLLKRAQSGDASTLPALRKALQDQVIVDQCGGQLAWQVEHSLIDAAAGKNLLFKEALGRKLELLRAELAGPSPSPLERLLADRAVTCWLFLHDREMRFVQAKDLTIHQAEYWQRTIDRAQKRYLSALRTLALVRKLALPVLQVNIARKHVNVAGPAEVADRKEKTA